MDVRRISDPLTPAQKLEVVTLDKAKAHLRVRHTDEDELIADWIVAAFDFLHGAEGWLNGYCLLQEQFEGYLGEIQATAELPLRPVVDETAVAISRLTNGAYVASPDGTFVVATQDDFTVIARLTGDTAGAAVDPRAYRVTFSAGQADVADVPMPLKQAILLLVGQWYLNREVTAGTASREIEYGLKALAGRYRVSPDHS